MLMSNEVNFEKRGKLEDHDPCPVTGECRCCCYHCRPPRTILTAIILVLLLVLPTLSLAQTINYDFETFDITLPGHPDLFISPADISDRGEILTTIQDNNLTEAVVIPTKVNKRGKVKKARLLSCSNLPFVDTNGEAINRRGDIVGSCIVGNKEVGFHRTRNGGLTLLDFPGADGTSARGLSDNGLIAGQFFGPLEPLRGGALSYRFHCFTYNPATNAFTQVDFPLASTFVDCNAINKRQQVLVRFIVVDVENTTLQAGWALYDSGVWSFPFPPSNEHIGGPAIFIADLNREGQAIVERSNGDDTWNGIFLFDDGVFFEIPPPDEWRGITVGGMNNKGEFVGTYRIQTGIDPYYGWPIFTRHGFLATPR